MKKNYFILFILLLSAFTVQAQQDAQFSQYMFNNLFLNPATAGSEGFTRFGLMYRNQWTGYKSSFASDGSGNPETAMFSFETPIQSISSGAGLQVFTDKLGLFNNFQAQGSFAYHYPLRNGKLSLGIRAGIYASSIDQGRIRVADQNDPIVGKLLEGKYTASALRPDVSAGIFYRTEKYYLGASVSHLVTSKIHLGLVELQSPIVNHVFFTGGYTFELNYELVFTPSVLVKSDLNTLSFDLNGLFTYNRDFWFGLGYRQGDAGVAMVGANMGKDKQGNKPLRIGYAFDFTIKGTEAKSRTSNEIMISYRLPGVNPAKREITRTPRFRQQ